jgi:hypothetical protein
VAAQARRKGWRRSEGSGVSAARVTADRGADRGSSAPRGRVGFGDPPVMFFIKLTEKGRQEVAGWPVAPGADFGAKLLDELERRIANAGDEEERTRLQRFRDAVADVGKGVVTGILADMARGI